MIATLLAGERIYANDYCEWSSGRVRRATSETSDCVALMNADEGEKVTVMVNVARKPQIVWMLQRVSYVQGVYATKESAQRVADAALDDERRRLQSAYPRSQLVATPWQMEPVTSDRVGLGSYRLLQEILPPGTDTQPVRSPYTWGHWIVRPIEVQD